MFSTSQQNQGKNQRKNQKKQLKKQQKNEQQAQKPQMVIEEPEIKFRNTLTEKLTTFVIEKGHTLFGSFVREYMCGRPFDYTLSDIDVFSDCWEVSDFIRHLSSIGFRVTKIPASPESVRYPHQHEKPFEVHHLVVGLMNDELFTGKKIEIEVDFVRGPVRSTPPFGCLDFECNAFIWDEYGIRLSRNTGTHIDSMSARDIKVYEQKILADAEKKVAVYVPAEKLEKAPLGIDSTAIYFRKIRAKRIINLFQRGWTITNFDKFVQVEAEKGDICTICGDDLSGPCMKLSCKCTSKYDHECFIKFTNEAFSNKTFIRCAQRCRDVFL
ncbi:Hypothetical protein HVR_LOCUS951 [uncultured virus]|nr:Hypothetical protein HVR_LOCUS951 [uncultured virus]